MNISQQHVGLVVVTAGMVGLFWVWWPMLTNKAEEPVHARESCRVLFVYDGDTIGCDLNKNGKIEKPGEEIRLLGIDTPEMHYSRKNKSHGSKKPVDEPFAKEASMLTENLTGKKTVYLEYDLERHDPYGRTLAYVYLSTDDPKSMGELLLEKGYAKTLFLGENRRLANEYYEAEESARQQRLGLWSD